MSKKIIFIVIFFLLIGTGLYIYSRYFVQIPYETWTYSSIDAYNKRDNLLLGNIKIENGAITSNIKDQQIKVFIDKNKSSWEKEELSYPIGGKTITGALWDGTKTTKINDDDHLMSIYTIFSNQLTDKYTFKLNRSRKYYKSSLLL